MTEDEKEGVKRAGKEIEQRFRGKRKFEKQQRPENTTIEKVGDL